MAHSYPFTLAFSNQSKHDHESEMYFEGSVQFIEDEETQFAKWEILVAHCTGFAQFNDGKVIAKVEGIRINASRVVSEKNWDTFEKACIDRACFEHELKQQKQAA